MARKGKSFKGGQALLHNAASATPYLLALLLLVAVIILAYKTAERQSKNQVAPHNDVKVVVIDRQADKPNVHPKSNPTYPLRGVPQEFQQMGVLVSQDTKDDQPLMLPLFGRKMTTRDRWEYYAASDKFNMWRIPIQQNKRMCDDDVGCDEIYNGDVVNVPDYPNKSFVSRIYKYDTPSY